jgi:hypothetical protein
MGHFAKVVDGKVTQVIVAEPEFFDTFVDSSPGTWLQTSYNTIGGKHTQGGTPLRGNYAGIGFTYDHTNDVFYAPSPFPSWVIDTATWLWKAPTAAPPTGGPYDWDEATKSWKLAETASV